MNLLEFNKRFPDEQSCRLYLKEQREKVGITCSKCQGTKHYWIKSVEKWKCASCGSRTNLRSGTMMEKSKLPVLYWFTAIHLMTSTKKTFSALEMQRQLGHNRYEPIWYMMNKVRCAMGKRDSLYQLQGQLELDEAYFEVVTTPERDELGNIIQDEEPLKRGKGSQRQATVLVIAESEKQPETETKKHKPNRKLGFLKMVVIDDSTIANINRQVSKRVSPQSSILTDASTSYNGLRNIVEEHIKVRATKKESSKVLPWVHTSIANAKRLFLGVHHSINRGYLQNYLNEFCYKLNRRNFKVDMFDRLIIAGVSDTWY